MSNKNGTAGIRVKKSKNDKVFDFFLYLLAIIIIIIVLYPMYFIIETYLDLPTAKTQ